MHQNLHTNFWKAIEIYISKPHTVNKRVSGVVHLGYADLPADLEITSVGFIDQLARQSPEKLSTALEIRLDDSRIIELHASDCVKVVQRLSAVEADPPETETRLIFINKLLSKNTKIFDNSFEIVLIDSAKSSATFVCCRSDADAPNQQCSAANPPYTIAFDQHDIHIRTAPDETSKSNHWLQTNLLPKLRNWSVPIDDASQEAQRTSIGTHAQLHSQEEYITLYNALKIKYGLDMVQRWPEQTDAAKFVYEDVAIASYLLVLWRQEREANASTQLQSFVDLGCGNGLLVYILSSEGHRGYGIDLRKRGIWDMYPATTQLKIEAIVPSDECLYPDIDWIIGNHSDELSPWVPVIAARSAPTTRYFLLPCCAFEFIGHKFQRRSAGDSQYNGFLDYVKRISDECGFETALDRLKIPSTKRVCLIGQRSSVMTDEQFVEKGARIQRFIDGETKTEATDTRRAWSSAFTPRPSVEAVRNCSTLERSLQTEIVRTVVEHLLAKRRFLDAFPRWNVGGQCPIADLVKLFPGERMKQMKSECGGLQTLLRNHNQVFVVQQGTVQIRAPLTKAERAALVAQKKLKALVRQRSCWFHDNHPDRCPIASEDCSFLHFD